jgi:hypothetical protein
MEAQSRRVEDQKLRFITGQQIAMALIFGVMIRL